LSRCCSHNRSQIILPISTSRFLGLTTRRPLLWLSLASVAIPETEVVHEEERLDTLHLPIPAVAGVEMERAASRLPVSIVLPFPLVQILQDVAIEEAEEDIHRTGIATFLHLSTPNSTHTTGGNILKAQNFLMEEAISTFSCNGSFSFLMHPNFNTTLVTEPHERCLFRRRLLHLAYGLHCAMSSQCFTIRSLLI